jgi:predicted patatin/cPLA2 family phospholipase
MVSTQDSVSQLIQSRLRQLPNRSDGNHLALVFESGGMRNTSTAGILIEFQNHGLATVFDSFHGSSSGACAALFFATGQAKKGAELLVNQIGSSSLIGIHKIFQREAIVETKIIVQDIIRPSISSFISDSVLKKMYVIATDSDSGKSFSISHFKDSAELFNAIEGSMKIPNVFRHSVPLRGRKLIDGALSSSIPIDSAIKSGATHILVLGNRILEYYHKKDFYWLLEALALLPLAGRNVFLNYIKRSRIDPKMILINGSNLNFLTLGKGSKVCGTIETRKHILNEVLESGRNSGIDFIKNNLIDYNDLKAE